MTDEETIQKLLDLRLVTMAQAFRDLLADPPGNQRSFTEKIAPMVEREWTERDNRRLARLLRAAHLTINDASLRRHTWDRSTHAGCAICDPKVTVVPPHRLEGRLLR
jgi:hypothetical protein